MTRSGMGGLLVAAGRREGEAEPIELPLRRPNPHLTPPENNMIRTSLTLAAATLLTAAAHAQAAPCSVLTQDEIKAVVGVPVTPGVPGGSKDAPDCTWKDAKGEDRVYVSLKTRDNYNVIHAQMQNTGRLTAVTGVGEDAFFVTSTGSTAYLYTLGKKHLLLLNISIPNASKQDNEAAEKALATSILPKL
jgi:hypothetical protein